MIARWVDFLIISLLTALRFLRNPSAQGNDNLSRKENNRVVRVQRIVLFIKLKIDKYLLKGTNFAF